MRHLRFTTTAEDDLVAIWKIIATDRPQAADALIDRLFEALLRLQRFPESGQRADEIRQGLRRLVVSSYFVFYIVGDDSITIVRVLSAYRDIDDTLFSDLPHPP